MGIFTTYRCDHCDKQVELKVRVLPMLWEDLALTLQDHGSPSSGIETARLLLCDFCASDFRKGIDLLLRPKKRSANLAEIYGKATLADIIARGPEKP